MAEQKPDTHDEQNSSQLSVDSSMANGASSDTNQKTNMKDTAAEKVAAEVDNPSEPAKQDDPETGRKSKRKRAIVLTLAGVVLIVGVIAGLLYYLNARHYESTDDAFIDGHVIQISPKISGYVQKVYVTDNQEVKEGDLLAEIDARDLESKLAQAKAQLEAASARQRAAQSGVSLTRATTGATVQQASSGVSLARSGVEQARAQAAAARSRVNQAAAGVGTAQANAQQARAQIGAADAEAARARADVGRYQELYSKDEVSRQRLDQAIATARTADAQLEAAQKRAAAVDAQIAEARAAQAALADVYRQAQSGITGAQAQVGQALGRFNEAGAAPQQIAVRESDVQTANAEIEQARTAVKQAELDLSYTKIYAPEGGRVTRKAIEEGAYVQPGQALLAVVPGDVWVTANFKETQLRDMRPNQPVDIEVDAYGKSFKAHIDSVQSGTGARFSLLPAENAAGNYVKVVQRVPVKIVFDEKPDQNRLLAPGMSVVPKVKVR